MKKISIVGVLVEGANWVLHPLANYKELQDYRRDYDKEVHKFREEKEKFEKKHEQQKKKYAELQEKYTKLRTILVDNEKKLQEYATAFPGDLHNYLDMQAKFEDIVKKNYLQDDEIRGMKSTIRTLEQKLIYRNNVITGLRNAKTELKYQIDQLEIQLNDARNQVVLLAKKVEFYEKQAKKTPKEKVDYLMKRGKK